MKNLIVAAFVATGVVAGLEAAPTDAVTQADLQALIQRIAKLEMENKAQADRIAELEGKATATTVKVASGVEEGTTTNESGRVYTTAQGFKYYLADKAAGIFEPLSESGLKITPYGYLVLEGVYNTQGTEVDVYSDYVCNPHSRAYNNHTSTLSMQDSILGLQFETPEAINGWTFTGRAEFDLAGNHGNDYAFHWRHLYVNAEHADTGWSILFGQTWHLWKMVTPSEIDGAWLENTGYPYRRSPQLRVTKKWDFEDSMLEARAGIVKNGPGMGGDRDDDGIQDNSASAWPLFEGALIYNRDAAWEEKGSGKRWLLGLAGQYGQDRSRNIYTDEKEDYNSMMIMVAGEVPYGDFKLTGQFFAGENLGGIQAGVGQRVIYCEQDPAGKEVQTIGGFIDLSYQITADWSAAIGYGFDHPSIGADYVSGSDGLSESIIHNDRIYIDVFYQITDNFKLGLEYARLNTRYAENEVYRGGNAYSDRIQFSAFYDF